MEKVLQFIEPSGATYSCGEYFSQFPVVYALERLSSEERGNRRGCICQRIGRKKYRRKDTGKKNHKLNKNTLTKQKCSDMMKSEKVKRSKKNGGNCDENT